MVGRVWRHAHDPTRVPEKLMYTTWPKVSGHPSVFLQSKVGKPPRYGAGAVQGGRWRFGKGRHLPQTVAKDAALARENMR